MSPIRSHKRDFRRSGDFSIEDLEAVFNLSRQFKADLKEGIPTHVLRGKSLAMIFEKQSLRTRSTFELGMVQLGGHAIYLSPEEIGLGKRETVADIARNLERWFDLGMARTFLQSTVDGLAENCRIPFINGLSDEEHPCQAMADYLTLYEQFGVLREKRLTYVGDGNNICHSLMVTGAKLGLHITVSGPKGYEPRPHFVKAIEDDLKLHGGSFTFTHDPVDAVLRADAIYTDVWASMGQESEAEKRKEIFQPYQLNERLVEKAPAGVLIMHDLPAHRGEEITNEVLDGENCIAFDQAENRLHVQKGILAFLDEVSE